MLSVIICTHNPNEHYLSEVLNCLKNQDLPFTYWELIVVDNASKYAIAPKFDLSWHPNAYHVVEEKLGLTYARLKGASLALRKYIVFVDDDNLLSPNYLSSVKEIAENKPYLGCFGGTLEGYYVDKQPDKKITPYLGMLAIRDIEKEKISNLYQWETTPAGAGLVVKKEVVLFYAELLEKNPKRKKLDRRGNSLMSSGDIDIAYTALDLGYMNGLFPQLKLKHIIPGVRLEYAYLLKLKFYNVYSSCILNYIRFGKLPKLNSPLSFFISCTISCFQGNFLDLKMKIKNRKAIASFLKEIDSF